MNTLVQIQHEFIRSWGEMGICWGINRTMAQIHALLMISLKPLSTDDIMRELKISRGNASMNVRELVSWGLIRRHVELGDRREYFVGVTDVWEMFCNIVRERKKREVEPVIQSLQSCIQDIQQHRTETSELALLRKRLTDLLEFVRLANSLMEKISRQRDSKALRGLVKIFK